jgi:hypothetical protein
VEYVAGEFYWKVEVEERVREVDYVAPPLMLSKEVSTTYIRTGGSSDNPELVPTGEINWSLGKYVPVKEVEKAFNVANLPRPSNVAPNQPFLHKAVYKYWLILLPILLLVGLAMTMFGGISQRVMTSTYEFPPLPNAEGTQVVFSEPFDLRGMRNVKVTAQPAALDNSWLYMEGDLINDETGLVQTFPISVEYYQGVEDGESWTEGSKEDDKTLSALPAGKYILRLEAQWEKWQQPMPVTVTVEQGATRGINFIFALIALSIVPVLVLIWHGIFESRRWSESMFGGSSSDDSE